MNTRSIIVLLACLVAFALPAVYAQQPSCVFNVGLFDGTGATELAYIPFDMLVNTYPVPTTHDFSTGEAQFHLDFVPADQDRELIIDYNVNGGADIQFTIPSPPMPTNRLVEGFLPVTSGCQVVNTLVIRVSINDRYNDPDRSDSCSFRNTYVITSNTGSACGDPQFVGLRGQSYQIHGIDGAVYNLISSKDTTINSRFEFLTGPRSCPVMPSTGKKSSACWSHDGSYLSNLAVATASEQILLQSGAATSGFSKITVNDRAIAVGESLAFSQGSLSVNSTHEVTMQVGAFYIEVENIDGFVNLRRVRVAQQDWASLAQDGGVHGLLGQTWRNRRYSGRIPEIEGSPDDYVIESDNMFGADFPYSRSVSQQ